MTTLALGERIGRFLEAEADRVETEESHSRVTHRVMVGKQVFIVTCEESEPGTRNLPYNYCSSASKLHKRLQ